jgi:hypothetical protein
MLSVGGRSIPGFTVNGISPGPPIVARQGQLIEVHLRNESVADGVTLHWHGVDVPNAMDGVAGVTQDAVPVGGEFTYRFVAEQAGRRIGRGRRNPRRRHHPLAPQSDHPASASFSRHAAMLTRLFAEAATTLASIKANRRL